MKHILKSAVLGASLTAMLATLPAIAGVSVTVGQPGFYGRIDLGDFPQPEVISFEPVIIDTVSTGVFQSPLYLRVPPGHAKHWDKHCAEYQACGNRVLFVKDHWYEQVYVPEYRRKHGPPAHARGKGHGNGKHKDKGKKD